MPQFKIIEHFHKQEPNQADKDLINLIKIKGREMLELLDKVEDQVQQQMTVALEGRQEGKSMAAYDVDRLLVANPEFWTRQAKTDFQLGIMKLIRAVTQPTDC